MYHNALHLCVQQCVALVCCSVPQFVEVTRVPCQVEFPKLFPSLLKTLRPLLSIAHANKENDFFRDGAGTPLPPAMPSAAGTCISGSAYNARHTTTDNTRYRGKAPKPKSAAAPSVSAVIDLQQQQQHTAVECSAAAAAPAAHHDTLLARVCASDNQLDAEELAEEAFLSCNLASGACAPAPRCTPAPTPPLLLSSAADSPGKGIEVYGPGASVGQDVAVVTSCPPLLFSGAVDCPGKGTPRKGTGVYGDGAAVGVDVPAVISCAQWHAGSGIAGLGMGVLISCALMRFASR